MKRLTGVAVSFNADKFLFCFDRYISVQQKHVFGVRMNGCFQPGDSPVVKCFGCFGLEDE